MRKYLFIFVVPFFLSGCFHKSENKTALPYHEDFKNADNYSLDAGAKFDPTVSATQGSGSVKLSKSGESWVMCDRMISDIRIPIKAGQTYTLSFKSKTLSWPPPSLEVFGAFSGENGVINNSDGTMCANSQKGIWEENYVAIKIPKNDAIKYFQIKILMLPKRSINAPIWIDDIHFTPGIHTSDKNIEKKSFDGSVTRVDKLGNIEIKTNGTFKPFFPIGIYADNDRKNWSDYKKMGFNINMWASNASSIKKAKEAGLYSMMQIVQYIVPVGEDWIPQDPKKKIAHLHKTLQKIKSEGLTHDLLFYYIDNEFYHLKRSFTQTVDIVRQEDNHTHPIYMLNGAYGMARKYNNYVDLTGTYVAQDGYETPIIESFEMLDTTPHQTQPVAIAQINRGVGKNFRAILYAALAKGAKGVGFWRDGGSAGKIEKRPIVKQLPSIAHEIQLLLPLIRTNHHTSWKATCDNLQLIFGSRTLHNEAYMIISNPSGNRQTGIFTLQNLTYAPITLKDYFSHKDITNVKKNHFSITLDPYEAKVVKLQK